MIILFPITVRIYESGRIVFPGVFRSTDHELWLGYGVFTLQMGWGVSRKEEGCHPLSSWLTYRMSSHNLKVVIVYHEDTNRHTKGLLLYAFQVLFDGGFITTKWACCVALLASIFVGIR